MRRGEIYSTRERVPECGAKPGFYVVVLRTFVAEHEDVSTVVCAPAYGKILGLTTQLYRGRKTGVPRTCAIRCDFLTLMFKVSSLTLFSPCLRSNLPNLTACLLTPLIFFLDKEERLVRSRSHCKIAFSSNP